MPARAIVRDPGETLNELNIGRDRSFPFTTAELQVNGTVQPVGNPHILTTG